MVPKNIERSRVLKKQMKKEPYTEPLYNDNEVSMIMRDEIFIADNNAINYAIELCKVSIAKLDKEIAKGKEKDIEGKYQSHRVFAKSRLIDLKNLLEKNKEETDTLRIILD